jgi:hypothetical protein
MLRDEAPCPQDASSLDQGGRGCLLIHEGVVQHQILNLNQLARIPGGGLGIEKVHALDPALPDHARPHTFIKAAQRP